MILNLHDSTDYVKEEAALVSDGGQGARDKDGLVATTGGSIDEYYDKDKGVIG